MKRIYLDHAATTDVDSQVLKAMAPFWQNLYGNPSSLYLEGRLASEAIEKAREKVASILNCRSKEIYFTAGGTESDNLAIFGTAGAYKDQGNHLVTTQIEHHAVLHSFQQLEKQGFKVTYLPVNKEGLVNLEDVKTAITSKTILVSIMYANNEIGTIEPISEISKMIKSLRFPISGIRYPILHTDACQAAGYLDLDIKNLGVDLLTLNGSKIYGPKGIGILYISQNLTIKPLLYGGGQEKGLRPGTENVPAIIGFANALELVQRNKDRESKRLIVLRDYLIKGIAARIPKVILNGHPKQRLPNNVNVSILDIEGEALILHLDKLGVAASTGSACTSGNLEPSHVLIALGLPYEACHGSLRLTLGKKTTKKEIDYVLKVLPEVVKKLRDISPIKIKI